jgi:ribosome maturation factor RimP
MADLAGLIEQAVTGLGYELVDFETSPRARLLRVFIDRPGTAADGRSGITVEDCAEISNHLTRLFTVENIDYDRLEVSSPGMDRPLKKSGDFARFAGHDVQLKLRIADAGEAGASSPQQGASSPQQGASSPRQRNFSGTLLGCDGERVRINTEGGEREFALDNIEKARLVPKF